MKTIKIEKNIPIPEQTENRGRSSIYPFNQMEIGDSFEMKGLDNKDKSNVRNSCRAYAKRSNKEFTWRHSDDKLRIWRIK